MWSLVNVFRRRAYQSANKFTKRNERIEFDSSINKLNFQFRRASGEIIIRLQLSTTDHSETTFNRLTEVISLNCLN
ncbi:MAG: hypothetical protein ACTS6G_00875 [Candidatus Hodgkinia cicadicola]